jgi:hypothetical protein
MGQMAYRWWLQSWTFEGGTTCDYNLGLGWPEKRVANLQSHGELPALLANMVARLSSPSYAGPLFDAVRRIC